MLDEIKGQPSAVTFLRGILTSRRFPKAMVFHGPPGVGKALTAKRFALESSFTGDPTRDDHTRMMFHAGDHPEMNFYLPEDCYTQSELSRRKSSPTWRVGSVRDFLEIAREPVIYGSRRTILFEDFQMIPVGQPAIPDAFLKILEDGIDSTTVILTTTELDRLPGTLRARLTSVRFARLSKDLVKSLLADHADQEHFDLSCNLGRGSLDETRDFLYAGEEGDGNLSGYDLRLRAVRLFKLLHVSSPGKILSFLSTLTDQDAQRFFNVVKSLYADMLLLESGVTQDLYHEDILSDLLEIVETYGGHLAKGLPALRVLSDRFNQPGIRFDRQIKSCFLDLKIRTEAS